MPLAHNLQRRQDLSSSESPSPSPSSSSPYLTHNYNPYLGKSAYASTTTHPALDLNYSFPPSDNYFTDSRQSTPSDQYNYGLVESQLMQNTPSQFPEVRLNPTLPDGLSSAASPPLMIGENDFAQSWNPYQTASFLAPGHQQQHTPTIYRSHKRLSSGSSIGTAGPDSPYTQSSVYPQIVDSDAQSVHSAHFESFDDTYTSFGQYSKQNFPTTVAPSSNDQTFFPAIQNLDFSSNNADAMTTAQAGMRQNQQRVSGVNGRTNTTAGSLSGDGVSSAETRSNPPQLDRTMSDVYQDELYNPAMISSVSSAQARPSVQTGNFLSPNRSAFGELLQAANSGHLSARSGSPVADASRQRSPFRETSQYAVGGYSQPNPNSPATRLNSSVVRLREQQKLASDAQVYARHQSSRHDFMNPPRTISPKEIKLDYHESEEDSKMPLFPSPKHESDITSAASYNRQLNRGDTNENSNDQSFASMGTSSRQGSSSYSTSPASHQSNPAFQFIPPQVPVVPQQYPFISHSRRQSSSMRSGSDQIPEFPSTLTSMESTKSESGQSENVRILPEASPPSSQEGPVRRPLDTSANSGTYTCTAPDCHLRFDTGPKLTKHRREAHRTSPLAHSTPTTPSSATAPQNAQAAVNNVSRNNAPGPHKCEKVNPSTGKPCNTVFSRSYDLTRHEDTIHNNRKQKVRCHLCTEEKTFSRNDALTRHMRVVHPDVEFPGKNRRSRNNDGADVVRQRIEGGRAGH